MESILKSEIFFFVATIALVLIVAGFLIVLYYTIRMLKDATAISRIIKEEAEHIRGDIHDARMYLREEAMSMSYFIGFVKAFFREPKKTLFSKKKRSRKEKKESE